MNMLADHPCDMWLGCSSYKQLEQQACCCVQQVSEPTGLLVLLHTDNVRSEAGVLVHWTAIAVAVVPIIGQRD